MTLIMKSFQAKDLPALDEDAANVFSKSERILLDHATKRFMNTSELKELIHIRTERTYPGLCLKLQPSRTRTMNGRSKGD